MSKIRSDVVFSAVDRPTRSLVLKQADRFALGRPLNIPACSVVQDVTGHINRTWIVAETDKASETRRFVVQNLGQVFNPKAIAANLRLFIDAQARARSQGDLPVHWKDIVFKAAGIGSDNVILFDRKGSPWRAMNFIPGNIFIFERFSSIPQSMRIEAARSLGDSIAVFGRILDLVPYKRLEMPLPNFHNARYHYDYLISVMNGGSPVLSLCQDKSITVRMSDKMRGTYRSRIDTLFKKIKSRTRLLDVLEPAGDASTHGDTKITNAVFSLNEKGKLVVAAWIDLDTIQKGNKLDDLGDALRSAGNPAGEEPKDIDQVCVDKKIVDAIISGYFGRATEYYTSSRIRTLRGLAVQSFMHYLYVLSMRSFADSLVGNKYWELKNGEPEDLILYRAEVQMRALEKAEEAYGI
ncbi:MAG: hypothetical protein NTZ10_04435 [Candidatus Saganbacteria bacterium]|nr:hypothetical protein [Candidatus Saganbacteria bacterium]